jgi:undecaprenyl-diphosphatase
MKNIDFDFKLRNNFYFLFPILIVFIIIGHVTDNEPEKYFSAMRHTRNFIYYFCYFINKYMNLIFYLIFGINLIRYARKKDHKNFRFVILTLVGQLIFALIAVHVCKRLFGAPRPYTGETDWTPLTNNGRHHSMPSGHATEISIFAGSLSQRKGALASFLWGLVPAATAFSRVYVGAHHSLDILGGVLIGNLAVFVVTSVLANTMLGRRPASESESRGAVCRSLLGHEVLCLVSEDGDSRLDLFERYLGGGALDARLIRDKDDRKVFLVSEAGRRYVLKDSVGIFNTREKLLFFLLFGPASRRLFWEENRAVRENCDALAKVYLVAERTDWFFPRRTISIAEYLPGENLEGLSRQAVDGSRKRVRELVAKLHKHRIAWVDVSLSNLIVNGEEMKVIDIPFIYPFQIGYFKDVVKLRSRMSIDILDDGEGVRSDLNLALRAPLRVLAYFSKNNWEHKRPKTSEPGRPAVQATDESKNRRAVD